MSGHTVVDMLPRDAIPSIDDPTFSDTFEGKSGETVIVVETATGARAYPTRILQNHEVVNDEVDAGPVAVTWCPLCASGVVYDRRVDGETLTFGVSGKLADNDLVLYDRETGSEWKQSSGRGLAGPHEGETLSVRPATTTTWDTFREEYPGGQVLQVPEWGTGDYETDRFADYGDTDHVGPGGDPRLRTEIADWDHDFGPKTPTLGLTVEGVSRGYPRSVVATAGGVVTDALGGTDVAVFAPPSGLYAYETAFDFEPTADDERFRADGTTWTAATGESEDGRRLDRLPTRRSFAFTWQDDHGPGTFYGGER